MMIFSKLILCMITKSYIYGGAHPKKQLRFNHQGMVSVNHRYCTLLVETYCNNGGVNNRYRNNDKNLCKLNAAELHKEFESNHMNKWFWSYSYIKNQQQDSVGVPPLVKDGSYCIQ